MTKDEVRQALERVLTWPPERQEDVVKMLEVMEEQDHSDFQLTDEQAAEVRRELARTRTPRRSLSKSGVSTFGLGPSQGARRRR